MHLLDTRALGLRHLAKQISSILLFRCSAKIEVHAKHKFSPTLIKFPAMSGCGEARMVRVMFISTPHRTSKLAAAELPSPRRAVGVNREHRSRRAIYVTTGSAERMNLGEGDNVFAVIKATEVSVERDSRQVDDNSAATRQASSVSTVESPNL